MTSEYDAFGPWIYEINEAHPLPPLFVPYYKGGDNYLMLVKIPRNIERRNANPGMDLYDYVIGMYEDHIYILKRNNKHIEEIRAFYCDIVGIEDLSELLKGTLTIYLKNNKIVIPFNTVSGALIVKLIRIIRDRYTKKVLDINSNLNFERDFKIDEVYTNLFNRMKSDDNTLQICAVQPSIPVKVKNSTFSEKISHLLSERLLINTMHLSNSRELIILSRAKAFNPRKLAIYSFKYTYIPLEHLENIKIENYEKYYGLLAINLKLPFSQLTFHLAETNSESINFYNNLNDSIKLLHLC